MKNKPVFILLVSVLSLTLIYILVKLYGSIFDDSDKEKVLFEPSGYYSLIRDFGQQKRTSNDVVFVGDSRIAGNDWLSKTLDFQVVARGLTGDSIAGLQYRMQEILRENPKGIVIECGINDLRNIDFDLYKSPHIIRRISQNFRGLIDTIQLKSPNTKIVIQSVLPVYRNVSNCNQCSEKVDTLNAQLTQICVQENVQFWDLVPILTTQQQLNLNYTFDGIHLNPTGYEAWEQFLSAKLKKTFF